MRRGTFMGMRLASGSRAAAVAALCSWAGVAAGSDLIRPVAATAQSEYYYELMDDRRAIRAIDGSGMLGGGEVTMTSTCGTSPSPSMWMSNGTSSTWITFDLGSVRTVAGLRLWNYNEGGQCGNGGAAGRGIRTCGVYRGSSMLPAGTSYELAGPRWGTLVKEMTFDRASGNPRQAGQTHLFDAPVTTRYLQLYVRSNFGECDDHTGIAEIRFIDVATLLGLGGNVAGSTAEIGPTDGNVTAVRWTVPHGTDLASLAPTYEVSSGVGHPASGARPSPGFDAGPVTYTITSAGRTSAYVVTAVEAAPPPPPRDPPTQVFVVRTSRTGLEAGDYSYLALIPASARINNGVPAVVTVEREADASGHVYLRDYLRRLRPSLVNTLNFAASDLQHPTARLDASGPLELSVAMARANWPEAGTVVLVSDAVDAANYPNVLQASALASRLGSPLLYHNADPAKEALVRGTIADLGATEVVYVNAAGTRPLMSTRVVTGPASVAGYLASRNIATEYLAATNPKDLALDTGSKLSLTAAHVAARRGGIVVPVAGYEPRPTPTELFAYSGAPIIREELRGLYASIGRYPTFLALVGNARSMPMSYSVPNENDGQFWQPPTDFDYANVDSDPFADLAVGRIMAYNLHDATLLTARISTYERLLDGTWDRTLAGVGADWDASAQAAQASNYGFDHVDLTGVDLGGSDQAIEAGIINNNYHSAAVTLGGSIGVGSTNILAPALVLSSGCAVGAIDFEMLDNDGVRASYRGTPAIVINDLFKLGAVGILASTRSDTGAGAMTVSKMLNALLAGKSLGQSWMDGVSVWVHDSDPMRISMYFGDPALRLHVPSAPVVAPASHVLEGDECGGVVRVSVPQTLLTPQMDPGMCDHWGLRSPTYWGVKAGLHGMDVDARYQVRCTVPASVRSVENVEEWPIVRSWVWGDIRLGLAGQPVMDVLRDGTRQVVFDVRANVMDWAGVGGGTVPLASTTSLSLRLVYGTGKEITSFRGSLSGGVATLTGGACSEGVITLHVPPQTTDAQIAAIRTTHTLDDGATCNQPNGAIPTPPLSVERPVEYVVRSGDPTDGTARVYSVRVTRQAGPFGYASWTGDADSGISSDVPHVASVNFAGPAVTVNGVPFAASATSGPNHAILGGVAEADGGAWVSGRSQTLAAGFIYGGVPRVVQLTGLEPGATYETTLFSYGWESTGRPIAMESGGVSCVIDQDAYGAGRGIRFMHRFMADESGRRVISLSPAPGFDGTFHLCAMTTAMIAPRCPADFNRDGGIDGEDVAAFFAAFESGEATADVNADGGVDGSDIESFMVPWQAGGC